MTIEEEIADFFRRYVEAFLNHDVDSLVELWEPVGLFPTPNGNFAMDRATFREHVAKLMQFYQREGVARPEGTVLSCAQIVPGVAEARVKYRMLDQEEGLVAEWEHFYILRRADGWRVTLTIADAEMAAWTERGAQF